MSEAILGISAYYHDSAAAIIVDGEIMAAAHEERFTRKKHDADFPKEAIKYVLEESGVDYNELTAIAFYDKPYIKFERLLETYHAFTPRGLKSFLSAMPAWIKEKLFMKKMIKDELKSFGTADVPLLFPEHHLSHAASAFYPSPYNDAAILTLDGVGEWATSTICHGKGKDITILKELGFPHSIGLLYSAFTYYIGFRVNSGEYKLMGLAPYGNPNSNRVKEYKEKIYDQLIDLREDGSILLNMDYFSFATELHMCNNKKWEQLFGIPRREAESDITQEYMDMAMAIQQVTENIVIQLAKTAQKLTGSKNIVLAGGVALNSVANGKLLAEGIFEGIWIQPASGDAGGSLGAAYAAWHIWLEKERKITEDQDSMKGAYLGPEYSELDIKRMVKKYNAKYEYYENFDDLAKKVADLISKEKVVGWFQGKMEFGPRSLGNRSIIGDARSPEMQKKMNLKIKYREGFRPFAPSVLEEDVNKYFDIDRPSPYMLLVIPINEEIRTPIPEGYSNFELYDRLYHLRSSLPSITHVDFSARIQTVSKKTNPRYWQVINEFKKQTNNSVIVNTSFNVRGEPMVCTPDDGYRCFMRTEMDHLVLGNFLFNKVEQKDLKNDSDWKNEFQLD